MRPDRIREALDSGLCPSSRLSRSIDRKDITTLGRGGSDVTAWRWRGTKADVCEIYTDVTASSRRTREWSPRLVDWQGVLDEMMEMAATGGRVLMLRSVEFARRHGVPLHVRSSSPGTRDLDCGGGPHYGRSRRVGYHDASRRQVTVGGVPDKPVSPPNCFVNSRTRASTWTYRPEHRRQCLTDISFTVAKTDSKPRVRVASSQA